MLPIVLAVTFSVGAPAPTVAALASSGLTAGAPASTSTVPTDPPPSSTLPAGAPAVPPGGLHGVSADFEGKPRYRSGLVLGLSLGLGVGGASGYPNDSTKIGDPRYYLASGPMGGASGTIFLMGALTDYLSFGAWFNHASYAAKDFHSDGNAGGLRVDVFPLIRLYPRLSGLAAFAEFGIGGGNLRSSVAGVEEAQGTQSFIGFGGFYEWSFWHLLGGHFAVGPSLELDSTFTQPFNREGLVASARLVFYGGP
jgi:hypothetical protein